MKHMSFEQNHSNNSIGDILGQSMEQMDSIVRSNKTGCPEYDYQVTKNLAGDPSEGNPKVLEREILETL